MKSTHAYSKPRLVVVKIRGRIFLRGEECNAPFHLNIYIYNDNTKFL